MTETEDVKRDRHNRIKRSTLCGPFYVPRKLKES